MELVILSADKLKLTCRALSGADMLVFRLSRKAYYAPGEIVTVRPTREWTRCRIRHLTGEVESVRLDATALRLDPLKLQPMGTWDPEIDFWREEDGDPLPRWARGILEFGPRPMFEMEQILPGLDPEQPFDDPIGIAVDLAEAGDRAGARQQLLSLCVDDLRCIDAHAHLGLLRWSYNREQALRHYAVGIRIAELSFETHFGGVLPWGAIDNRPYLRCMQGYGLCLWRLGNPEEARGVFERMLWLNPADNQGIRMLLDDIDHGRPWRNDL